MSSLCTFKDLTRDDLARIYEVSGQVKSDIKRGNFGHLQAGSKETTVFLLFFENSTRTKESFRSAALFHNCNVVDFSADSSSVQKKETLLDTCKTLCQYGTGHVIFVIRSKIEGVQQYLWENLVVYGRLLNKPVSVINAGDGKHEHPSQELLDIFSFGETLAGSRVHVAMIGDLKHGRTVHSKCEGLRVFEGQRVDLVAPPELELPDHLARQMPGQVRKFPDLKSYLEAGDVAPLWYFTRLQEERMTPEVLSQLPRLRQSVTMTEDLYRLAPQSSQKLKFFHPLPRNSEHPVIPYSFDHTPCNAWDGQSENGYFVRIALLKLILAPTKPEDPRICAEKSGLNRQLQLPNLAALLLRSSFEFGFRFTSWKYVALLATYVFAQAEVLVANGLVNFRVTSSPDHETHLQLANLLAPPEFFRLAAGLQFSTRPMTHDQLRCPNGDCVCNSREVAECWVSRVSDTILQCHYCDTRAPLTDWISLTF